jgi:hypothetical protein
LTGSVVFGLVERKYSKEGGCGKEGSLFTAEREREVLEEIGKRQVGVLISPTRAHPTPSDFLLPSITPHLSKVPLNSIKTFLFVL